MATRPIDVIARGDSTPASARRLIREHLDAHPDGYPRIYTALRGLTWKVLAERRGDPSLRLWRQLILKIAKACPDPKYAAYLTALADMYELSIAAAKAAPAR